MRRPKHEPVRSCVACRRRGSKKEFVRVVRQECGTVRIDDSGKLSGRGAYICARQECLKTAIKKKALARGLRLNSTAVTSLKGVYEDLLSRIGEGNSANR